MRAAFLTALLVLRSGCNIPSAPAPRSSPLQSPGRPTPDDPLRQLELKVFAGTNRERQLHGLPQLAWSEPLARQARLHSTNMMERGFFSHKDPIRGELSPRLNSAGIRWSRIAENIFRERGLEDPPGAAVDGWMRSPAHRQNLLDPLFTHTGVGIAISPDTEYFITQLFIRAPVSATN